MEKPLISIVVPVYNMAQFLPRCLQSIVAQTYVNTQIIVVDDGSTDSTAQVARQWAQKEPRLQLVQIAHGGLAAARNAGLDAMRGQCVAFIDSDDWITPDFIDTLWQALTRHRADIAECAWNEVQAGSQHKALSRGSGRVQEFSGREALLDSFYQHTLCPSMCRRLFAASVFSHFRLATGRLFEDLEAEYAILSRTRRLVYVDRRMYCYIHHPSSLLGDFTPARLDVLNIMDELEQTVAATGDAALLKAVRSRSLSASLNMLRHMPPGNPSYDDARLRCWHNVRRLRGGCLTDRHVRCINKIACLLSLLGPGCLQRAINGR